MSLLISEPREQKFLARFENVWASLRRFQVRQGLAWTFLAAALGLAALAAADHRWELPRQVRAVGLAAASALTLAVLVARVVVPSRWWTKPRTAVEIERRFPALGQRIRTVVQFAGLPDELVESEGVTPALVGALEEETEGQVGPLPLDAIIPWRRVWATAALAAVPALVLGFAAATSEEWRLAVGRALLGGRAYTTLAVTPGTLRVDQNDRVPIAVEMRGRPRRDVVLQTRAAGKPDAPWKDAEMEAPKAAKGSPPRSRREATLEKVKDPLVYRVVAGPVASPTFTIDVRYPLAVRSFEVALSPPEYTGIQPSTVKGGDLSVIEGTGAAFRIAFDGRPTGASLVPVEPAVPTRGKAKGKDKGAPAPRVIPLQDEGSAFVTEMTLTKGLVYRIEARTADGRVLPKNRYRIDVHEDRPPRVSFEEPEEALEVHAIAEVLNRARVGDDFGLTKAGIVFRFNDGDEQTLVARDFTAAAGKGKARGKRETSAALEEWLLLEKLAASPADSVTYYAFAEDNYPAGARRTETDLRYIDIRPFQREYKKGEGGDDAPEGEGQSASLKELIARQRYNLNRGVRLARRKPDDRSPAEDPLKIAGFEENLATMVRELTEGVERIADQRVEPLHQAEEAMLAAVGAIDLGKNADAPGQMANALRHLIEVRKTLQEIIGDADSKLAQALRAFDRSQAQKIRKPKNKEGEAEEIAERLEELAQEEDFVYATIARAGTSGMEGKTAPGEKGDEAEKGKAEPKDADAPEKKADAPKGQEGDQGEKGDKGKGDTGPKGSGSDPAGGKGGGKGEPDDKDKDGDGPAGKNDPRETMKKQESIVDEARALEERLKKLEVASDLAKARMAKAAETAEKAAGALARGNSKEATETTRAGAAMLHELARQVKGEVAREVAEELAMARDLAAELAEREAELAGMNDGPPGPGSGEEGKGGKGKGPKGSPGSDGRGPGGLTDAERLERLQEAAKTLEEWLKGASLRAEGDAAEKVREVLEEAPVAKVVDRMARVGELILGGQKPEAGREAKEAARMLEALSRKLDVLHRGIVAPQLAALVEEDRRVGELIETLKTLKTDAEISE